MKHYVLNTEQFGRGIYAGMDMKKGEIVFTAEILVLSEKDTPIVNSTDLQWYTFTYNDKQDCLVLGDGEIFNHSDTPEVSYELTEIINGRRMMKFTLLKDVKENQQLFIDYNADVIKKKEDVLADYKTNMM